MASTSRPCSGGRSRCSGPRGLLFGTDSSTFPRGWRADILRDQRSILSTLAITASDQERILGGNVAEILELD
jgi:hypothetical protein